MKENLLKEDYRIYSFNCYCEGDIWNSIYRPYTYNEWIEHKMPSNGGIKL